MSGLDEEQLSGLECRASELLEEPDKEEGRPREAALHAALPGAVGWLCGCDDVAVPPGTIGGAVAARRLADLIAGGVDADLHGHLVYFAIKVGARRLTDAATALVCIGRDQAAVVTTRQARLVGGLE